MAGGPIPCLSIIVIERLGAWVLGPLIMRTSIQKE